MPTIVARLPEAARGEFEAPLGPIFESVDALLAAAGEPIVAVGDVVVAHLGQAGHVPALAVVDGRTERAAVESWVLAERPAAATETAVENPAGTITAELVAAIETGLDRTESTRIVVDGEEDLAVLPAVLLAPRGATVVYGQPGEGMVGAPVNGETRSICRERLALMERDEPFWAAID